ncbi:MAG TPA: autotransporter-associated beta strand repeat-containing protein, partial [Candidatus Paceibacterota bacterium]|nr:autotransporter-associated beta strand repeat-containing protein [Candidatus Paceibacterota bacterium]
LTVLAGGNIWAHDGNGNWSAGANWSANPVIPRLPGDSAIFGAGSAFTTVALDTNVSVGSISFTNPYSFHIADAGKTLTLATSFGNLAMNVSGGQSNSITAPVVLNGTLGVSVSGAAGLSISGNVSGAGSVVLGGDGTGFLTLGGSNTYSGGTVIGAGTLALASTNALGTNTLTLNGGNLDSVVTNLVNANNNPQIWLGSFGFLGSQNLNLGAGSVTVSNNVTVSVTNKLVVGGTINASAFTVTLIGDGTVELDANNSIGGLNSGVNLLVFGNDNAAGNGILSSFSPTAAFASSSSATRTIHNVLGTGNGANGWTFGGTGNLVFDGGVTSYNFGKTVTVNNPVTTWNFALPSGAGGTFKQGIGTLVLNGANANTGGNTVNEGTLALGKASALGTGTLVMNGGNLDCLVANMTNVNNNVQTWNTNFTFLGSQSLNLGNGSVTMTSNVTVTVGANVLTVEGAINDGALGYSLGKSGSGLLRLTGANTYTGNTIVHAGTLELANAALAASSTVEISAGATLRLDFSGMNTVTSLVLNGVTQPAGTYGSSTPGGFIAGTGLLQVTTGPAEAPRLTSTVSGSTLQLSWVAEAGWRLQMQTNSLSVGLGTNWIDVTDGTTSSTNITIDPTHGAVFFRLIK